ncbi:MAG: hypothetical protein ACYDCO_06425 [Armatimonadota bacterium]
MAVSADRMRFRKVAHLHMPGDNRDPKLLPLDDNRMALYFPSWTHGGKQYDLQHFICYSDNGYTWSDPTPILAPRRWLWRIRPYQGRYYGLVQDITADRALGAPHQLDLIVSDDLHAWDTITRIGAGQGLCESDIYWHEDGEAWVVARSAIKRQGSFFCSAPPPYTEWHVTEMTPMVHAPIFLHHDGALYVAGRSRPAVEGDTTFPFPNLGASLGLWRVTRGALEPVLRIPAYGDCSYPGLIKDPEGRICMSYYSQHAYHLGVIEHEEGEIVRKRNDVYFAELEL